MKLRDIALCAGLAAAVAGSSWAQEGPDLPKVTVLSCEQGCVKRIEPKPKGDHIGYFPASEQPEWIGGGSLAEAFVIVRYTITAQGLVKDPVLVRLVGPAAFGKAALETVKGWTYEPATVGGVPIDRPNWCAIFNYRFSDLTGAREEVYRAYHKAQDLLAESKFAEIDALLIPVLQKPRLLLYERAMVSLLLSITHGMQKDYFVARDYAEDATLLDGALLPAAAREQAFRQRLDLEAATGQFGDALNWYEKLKSLKHNELAADDHDVQLVDRIRKRLADPAPIRVAGYISATRPLPTWNHTLLRRHFAFPVINGKLSQFELDCDENRIASPITATAEWHVPRSWSNCHLRVEGEAGTTFQLVEANE